QLPYWQAARAGLMRAAAQLQVRADFAGPNTYDPKAQQQEFQRVVRLKPSGILISPADPALMKADIDAAIDAGIPVITIDSDSPESKRLAFVGTNNYQAGLMGGKLAATQLKGKGSVAVYGMPEQTNLNERLKGYQEAFSAHPQIKIVEVINVKGDPRIAFDSTGALLDKLKDKVDAFVCLEATAGKEVAEVLSRRQIKGRVLVAMDTDQGTLEWIQKGVIAATIGQKPFTMAFYGLKMLDDLLHHKLNPLGKRWAQDSFSPIPTFVDTGATLIDKGSVGEFLQSRDSATADKNP
ncbi:MAG: substrate-binding domain-containing protein, partial [Acidobacteria bacterium]|nr:substrate-binding domain-containing protein [Acidobacteriota bacterium]